MNEEGLFRATVTNNQKKELSAVERVYERLDHVPSKTRDKLHFFNGKKIRRQSKSR